jgi:hypothetical protein
MHHLVRLHCIPRAASRKPQAFGVLSLTWFAPIALRRLVLLAAFGLRLGACGYVRQRMVELALTVND